ncbi:hypothetical protein [Brucella sp. NBRC 12950]|uniref:hypothetical protein n=1 Tax=Brucella sp. NBRC 12950 TaxID=2994518 RepID=UPI0024A33677|nr:hypothetical protein [Brucella sp. NBRC 12950]GLU29976.1 hypothetical protein Brsp01_52090 [Brucella sp. NBRC 12950]
MYEKLTKIVKMFACCVLVATPVVAQSMTDIPVAWSDVDQTRELEALLQEALETHDGAALSTARAKITAVDQIGMDRILRIIDENETEELNSLSLKMSSCHYAGMLIRLMILDLYETSRPTGPENYSISETNAAHFAEHMNRCERLSARLLSPRLIGNTH